MCIICIELLKQKLTLLEAETNAKEMSSGSEHVKELYESIKEFDIKKLDKVLDDGINGVE